MGNNLNFKTINPPEWYCSETLLVYTEWSKREYSLNTNNINKNQKLVVREEKILKQKQNKPSTLLEITKMRIMYAPVSQLVLGSSLASNTVKYGYGLSYCQYIHYKHLILHLIVPSSS